MPLTHNLSHGPIADEAQRGSLGPAALEKVHAFLRRPSPDVRHHGAFWVPRGELAAGGGDFGLRERFGGARHRFHRQRTIIIGAIFDPARCNWWRKEGDVTAACARRDVVTEERGDGTTLMVELRDVGVIEYTSGVPVPLHIIEMGTLEKRSVITTLATTGGRFNRRHILSMKRTPGESVRVLGKLGRW